MRTIVLLVPGLSQTLAGRARFLGVHEVHILHITNNATNDQALKSEQVHTCNSLHDGLRWLSENAETGHYAIMPRTDRTMTLNAIHFVDVVARRTSPDMPADREIRVDGSWNY